MSIGPRLVPGRVRYMTRDSIKVNKAKIMIQVTYTSTF